MTQYATSLDHIFAELECVDLLIHLAVERARCLDLRDEEFHGFYIPEEEVDVLLASPVGLPEWATESHPLLDEEINTALTQLRSSIAQRTEESHRQGETLRLHRLCRLYQLSPLEVDILLLCLAPELDLRYERLYGYLHDDITRKRPSVDLALNLLSPTIAAKVMGRRHFVPSAPLFRHSLLRLVDDPTQPQAPLLRRFLVVEPRIVDYLLDGDETDPRLAPYVHLRESAQTQAAPIDEDTQQSLWKLSQRSLERAEALFLCMQGTYGVGRRATAQALTAALGLKLLVVDGETLLDAQNLPFDLALRLLTREARLQNALIYWDSFGLLLTDERRAWRDLLLDELATLPQPTFFAADKAWAPTADLAVPFITVPFRRPDYPQRVRLWSQFLSCGNDTTDADVAELAGRFRFSTGQIHDAVATAHNVAQWRDPDTPQLTMDDLRRGCRLQSNPKLAELAAKIEPHYTWDDIVLPADRMAQLREIVHHVTYRGLVYDTWGFDGKLAMGKGLNVLFAGPSGTGKTMAADIMAGELSLDLYKIDLASVVSKYIGETEKNLARIFAEAETSNAILFFDEADALFGKRSEVRDSHDRYANIEISYLLQRMETYKGMTILATNLQKNLDEAFARRMHFTVEFPFPGEANRRRIWAQIWPDAMPRSPVLDLDFMAQHFDLTGGAIRNIALSAAFLAADDGDTVQMRHLLHATQREYQKMGKVVIDGEFDAYIHEVHHARPTV
ncbi:AAA family ATPase [bacterium]|nr:AAA family ATPase [bacterium]